MSKADNSDNGKVSLPIVKILDKEPLSIKRPLSLVDGQAYAATWLPIEVTEQKIVGSEDDDKEPKADYKHELFIIRGDGKIFSEQLGINITPMRYLGAKVELPEQLKPTKMWSSVGVKNYLKGYRPDPVVLFEQVVDVIDQFIDFDHSFTNQREMAEFIACYILATWFLDAFNVIGYLWPTGGRGSGKTQLLSVITEIAYLGELILNGGSYAALRDLADYGATLAFDDAENLSNPKFMDLDKRALLLAGNRRGNTVTLKELKGKKWVNRYVHTFCARLFSAIRTPDPVLSSRTIIVPLIRTPDRDRANSDPLEYDLWPHDRRKMQDDLWALGLAHLPELPAYERAVNQKSRLRGRSLEPWRAVLAVAMWLDDNGVKGISKRMEQLAWNYNQEEQASLQSGDLNILTIRALIACAISANNAKSANNNEWFFPTSQVTDAVIEIIESEEIDINSNGITSKKVGKILSQLRLEPKRPSGEKPRGWVITRNELERLCRSYSIQYPEDLNTYKSNGTNGFVGTNGINDQPSFKDLMENSPYPDISKPCYACGELAWYERPFERGGGWCCGTCHPDHKG